MPPGGATGVVGTPEISGHTDAAGVDDSSVAACALKLLVSGIKNLNDFLL
jgi:hypothetical protein